MTDERKRPDPVGRGSYPESKEPRKTKCHYCGDPMGDECHYVIKNGKMIMAHKQCHAKSQEENTNLRIIIKGGSSCRGGTCRR